MSLPLLPGRTCGGCVECCRVIPLNLPELAKPTGKLCAYCVDGAGCSVHEIRPNTCRIWFCLWRVVELSDDWRPDRSGVIVRPDGVEDGVITLYVLRRSDFLASPDFFVTVAGWVAEGIEVALSIPGPVGTYPARAVVTDWLRPAIEDGDTDAFTTRVLMSLDTLAEHDFQPDGVVARYAVTTQDRPKA
ncbi:MAG: hypothetical protein WC563_02765 [Brevundimonas sp.]|uniref:hypothetical protein n=1 Tax=Brevundimonas sp. Leaf280 TaxID=1736320 RepID=UPI0006F2DFEC|nr:hypothetical protein [Brevundimonas sp. Leaf280]KQP48331.1 hypothetical protein ASF31_03100 [Brevundimonas sp. Leaf280]